MQSLIYAQLTEEYGKAILKESAKMTMKNIIELGMLAQ
jgi:hypothetical protein